MFDFPLAPTVGATYNVAGKSYVWDGEKWRNAPSSMPPGKTALSRNRIVNPAMQISQENGTVQATAAASINYFAADMWLCAANTATASLRAGSGPTGVLNNTAGCFLNILTAQASLATTQLGIIRQNLEGLSIADFQWGTATAKPVVLRFSVKTPVAGTYGVRLANGDVTRSYVAVFNVPTANTWQDVVLAIPGDTAGVWPTDNSKAVYLDFTCGIGSTYVGAAGWQAGNFYTTAAQVNGLGTVGLFNIANVGLYLDPDATGLAPPFQTPNLADELRRCYRYYQRHGGWAAVNFATGTFILTTQAYFTLPYLATMRYGPTVSVTGVGDFTIRAATSICTSTALVTAAAGLDTTAIQMDFTPASTAGWGCTIRPRIADACFILNARM